jgi:multiple sugar transport system substrate-binding protein
MKNKRWIAVLATAAVAALALTGCSSGSSGSASSACQAKIVYPKAPQVSVWAWYPHFDHTVEQFNESHKNVQVCWTDAGAGTPEYTKFSTAIKAGSGAPDVVMLETDHVPSFVAQKGLVNLNDYGAKTYEKDFSAGAWDDETVNGGVYGIPVDGGPVGLLYRKDIFTKYGLTVPTTWAEYMADAKKLKAAGSTTLMTDFPGNAANAYEAVLAQAGGENPFTVNGTKLTIDVNSAGWKNIFDYWGQMVSQKLVGTEDSGTTDYNTHLVNGTYASVIAAAWEPGYLIGLQGGSKGAEWAAAPLPQWDPSNPVQVNIGGSAFGVSTQATNKKLAAEVAEQIYSSTAALDYGSKSNIIFPLNQPYTSTTSFVDYPYPFFNNQTVNKDVFVPASKAYKGLPASPFQDYFYDQLNQATVAVIQGKGTPSAELDSMQSNLVAYAKTQGYTVN